ncbi:neuralized E3 ubiquitin protein ligase 1B [Cricetulus griseus]
MGNTVHRTLPGTRGAAPRGGAERSVLPGQPRPRSPGCTPESGCQSLIPGAAPLPGRADPAWFSWPWPCAPRLCSSPRSLRSEPGAIGASPAKASRGASGHGCPGSPRAARRRPHHTCYFLAAFPRAPGCAPAPVSAQLGVLSHCCGAHRPLVKSALEFPRPEKDDSSPPARLLATRPCYGPGPERRAVLGEAPRFHAQAKGKNVRLDGHSRRATRRNSFCNGVTFTQRPIRLYEQVRLRLVAVRPGWSGALRFGFTAHDPSLMSAQDIPKYACPDLVTRPGYWAKALPENLALRDTVLAYWADRHGRVFYSVNDGEPVLFHCGVAVGGPLWALIDVYGITDEVQLLESTFADTLTPLRLGQARLSACPPPGSHDTANFDNNELENNQVVAKLGHLALGRPDAAVPCVARERARPASSPALLDAELRFHATRGPDVSLSADRRLACAPRPDGGRTLVFSERPLRPGESLCVEVGRPGLAAPAAVAFGITSCDPGALRPSELPADPAALLDRKEYWVVARAGPVPSGGDSLSFTLRPGGDVLLAVNGRPRGRLLCVDTSQALWAFFVVRGGAAGQLRLLGTLQSSPETTTPSGSFSGSQDDSDSDMTFSVNQSSSASESSLVTAPSSPLSPPVSPVFSAPEPAGSRNGECTVCFDSEVDTVIYTCGHMCLCHSCGLRLRRQARACCPICRRPIKDVIKIYRP